MVNWYYSSVHSDMKHLLVFNFGVKLNAKGAKSWLSSAEGITFPEDMW